ncbi:glycosyltransferase family 25 protein [Actinobacillus equuli subsp. equuli]|uniref:Glycosyltransferase family 25 protein n=1 Tax=Actinobacillus equuli subsp. equuli TaxID=202947 RepID=A0A9X4G661_ACTEU|nr:glycosyltransferase family 25 protein [Actinobacillus equuli]MDE8034810.1 glycosyltransferase family 25 protein [Actinobacillus equuli subsp. equuli]MDG4948978.1 glycosyltransferase family 25 protein [Actinobacillus equuli subsp. haemolyticus]
MIDDKMPIPPIFVISLANSVRRKIISARLNSLGLAFEFIDAVNGRDLTEEQLSQVDYDFYPQRFGGKHKLKLGEIGCAMSHIKAYQNNIKEAIILEDDAIVSHYFRRIVADALRKVPSRKQIIFFDHGKAKYWPITRSLKEGYRLVRYRSPSKNSKRTIMITTGYYLTLDGAKLLLKHAYPVRMPSDSLTGALQMTGIKAYGVEPPCIFISPGSEIDEIEKRG